MDAFFPFSFANMRLPKDSPCKIDGIDTEFEVMTVTPQTPKRHHNRGATEVVVTFGSLWCHSHDRKQGINFYSIMIPQN